MADSFVSDSDDRILFHSLDDEVVDLILRIKHNVFGFGDERLAIKISDELSAKSWTRLGQIVGNAEHVPPIEIQGDDLHAEAEVAAALAPLAGTSQFNEYVTCLVFGNVNLGPTNMGLLDSFLRCSPRIDDICLYDCNLDSAAIDLLANSLLERSDDSLECLELYGNDLGDIDLDQLVEALMRNVHLDHLSLGDTGIGSKACASLAKLLSNHPSLCCLDLAGNAIDDTGVSFLVDSLTENTNLDTLSLGRISLLGENGGFTGVGLSMLLKLLCNSSTIESVIKSNHTLHDLAMPLNSAKGKKAIERALGTDDANLLRASLKMNFKSEQNDVAAARLKILWCHARNDLNIGVSSVPTGSLHRILAWIGGGRDDEADTSRLLTKTYTKYHRPPLKKAKLRVLRLDSVYRIVRSRPGLCGTRSQVS